MTFPLFSTIGYSYRLLFQSLPTLLGLLAIALIIGLGLGFISTTMILGTMTSGTNSGEGFLAFLAGTILLYIVIAIFFLWMQNSAVMIVGSIAIGRTVTIGDSLSRGFKSIPIIFCFLLLYYLATSVILYPMAMLLQGFGMSLTFLNIFSGVVTLILLTFFLPAPFLAIVNKAGFGSLKQSLAMTRDSRFKIFLGILISYLTAVLIALVLFSLSGGVLSLMTYTSYGIQLTDLTTSSALLLISLGVAAYSLVMSIILCYFGAVYAVLKVNKDTMDKALEEAMTDMSQNAIPQQDTDTSNT